MPEGGSGSIAGASVPPEATVREAAVEPRGD